MGTALKLLVGIDFSDASTVALSHALLLAERTEAELHLSHIAPSEGIEAPVDLGLNVPAEFEGAKDARIRLERMRAMIGGQHATCVHVRIGDAAEGLLQLSRELRPDFLLVGSNGSARRPLLGTVSARLVERSPVPVVVVPTPGDEIQPVPVPVGPPLLPSA